MTAIEKKTSTFMFIFQCTHLHPNQCLEGNTHKGYDFNGNPLFDHCVLEYLWLLSFGEQVTLRATEPEELGSFQL